MIDALDPGWRAHFRIDGERCVLAEREPPLAAFVCLARDESLESWRYEERGMVLRSRAELLPLAPGLERVSLRVLPARFRLARTEAGAARIEAVDAGPALVLEGRPLVRGLAVHPVFVAVALVTPPGVRIDVLRHDLVAALHVLLDGATSASMRVTGEHLVIADDVGRVLVIDLGTGALVRDLRARG